MYASKNGDEVPRTGKKYIDWYGYILVGGLLFPMLRFHLQHLFTLTCSDLTHTSVIHSHIHLVTFTSVTKHRLYSLSCQCLFIILVWCRATIQYKLLLRKIDEVKSQSQVWYHCEFIAKKMRSILCLLLLSLTLSDAQQFHLRNSSGNYKWKIFFMSTWNKSQFLYIFHNEW